MEMPAIVTRKFGPLPGWGWGAVGLAVALGIASWRARKAKNNPEDVDAAGETTYTLPDSLQPTYVFQNYDQDITYGSQTTVNVPPGGGRPAPPRPAPTPTPLPRRDPPTPVPVPTPKPTPAPPKPTPAPAPSGTYVTVVPWKSGQPKGTPSTIWGIAEKVYGKASNALTSQIWNAPQNASLKANRKAPDLIRAGDKVYVPK